MLFIIFEKGKMEMAEIGTEISTAIEFIEDVDGELYHSTNISMEIENNGDDNILHIQFNINLTVYFGDLDNEFMEELTIEEKSS